MLMTIVHLVTHFNVVSREETRPAFLPSSPELSSHQGIVMMHASSLCLVDLSISVRPIMDPLPCAGIQERVQIDA